MRWWDEESHGMEVHEAVFAAVERLDEDQEHRRASNLHHLRMYSNRLASGLTGNDYSVQDHGSRIKINVIKAVIDAATAMNATNRPRPMFLTTGGNQSQLTRAKRLNKFMSGQFYSMDMYKIAAKVFQDTLIFGTGFLKFYSEKSKIKGERVFPDEILVDDVEARDSNPRTLYQHKTTDKQSLKRAYKKKREDIENAALIRDEGLSMDEVSDRCSVVETWHLPSFDGAGDGRHVIAVSNATLLDEPWEYENFPFAVFRYCDSPLGFWGIGMAEELTPLQVEINFLAVKVQTLMNLSTTQLWVQQNENVGALNNRDMAINTYQKAVPTAVTIQPVSEQILRQMWDLYQKAFEISGVSHAAATSQAPAGLKSGEALKRHNELGSRRFQHVGQAWERFFLDASDRILDIARSIEESGDGDVRVLAEGDKDVEEISFSDVSIKKDKYVMRVFPTSLLPDTPQGKIEAIQTLAGLPEYAPHVGRLLTGVPDVENISDLLNAPYELITLHLEAIVERGEFNPPAPYMDLESAQKLTALTIQRSQKDGVPEDRIELLRRYLDQVLLMSTPPAPEMPPMDPMGAMPPMDGMAPPVPGLEAPPPGLALPPGPPAGLPQLAPPM